MFILKKNVCLSLLAFLHLTPSLAKEQKDLWKLLTQEGHFVMIRHALAPGTGDPKNFKLGDCKTQRNLSDKGRNQAKKIGELFRKNGISQAEIYSSQWCRCLETARLMGIGKVNELSYLNSFWNRWDQEKKKISSLRNWLQKKKSKLPLVLITHYITVNSLTGVAPSSGEIVFLKNRGKGQVKVLGRIQTEE